MRPLSCLVLALAVISAGAAEPRDTLADPDAPVSVVTRLNPEQIEAARQGRLGWSEKSQDGTQIKVQPVQWELQSGGAEARATWLMPAGSAGQRASVWCTNTAAFSTAMRAVQDSVTGGQVELRERDKPVLRYNYRTIEPGELLSQITEGNRIYARGRSDYIHPLYGIQGEELTLDWALDHPHHRGIYWAWPEVDYQGDRGDLHALQKVFARPTGKLKLQSGPVFAQVEAENLWLWEDREPIVREWTVIRAYRSTEKGRVVDLQFHFTGLKDGVTIARRGMTAYGGLNIRMSTPRSQVIQLQTDVPGASPRRAWSDLSGVFRGEQASGLTVLQHQGNPEYPGEWIQYPELSWVQPTFPTAGTRYGLSRDQPLVLRFRLWIHPGATPPDAGTAKLWDAFHSPVAALIGLQE